MQLAGNTLIATGGASGLAEGTVRRFVKHGANAIILDLDETRGAHRRLNLDPKRAFAKRISNPKMMCSARWIWPSMSSAACIFW